MIKFNQVEGFEGDFKSTCKTWFYRVTVSGYILLKWSREYKCSRYVGKFICYYDLIKEVNAGITYYWECSPPNNDILSIYSYKQCTEEFLQKRHAKIREDKKWFGW